MLTPLQVLKAYGALFNAYEDTMYYGPRPNFRENQVIYDLMVGMYNHWSSVYTTEQFLRAAGK